LSETVLLALINSAQVLLLAYLAYRQEQIRQHVKNGSPEEQAVDPLGDSLPTDAKTVGNRRHRQ